MKRTELKNHKELKYMVSEGRTGEHYFENKAAATKAYRTLKEKGADTKIHAIVYDPFWGENPIMPELIKQPRVTIKKPKLPKVKKPRAVKPKKLKLSASSSGIYCTKRGGLTRKKCRGSKLVYRTR